MTAIRTSTPAPGTNAANVSLAAQKDGLAKAAKQFEAVFLRQMLSSMRSASQGEDIFGSSATDQFRDMQDSRLADTMTEKGNFGVAELLLKQFSAQQAGTAPVTGTGTPTDAVATAAQAGGGDAATTMATPK